MTLNLGRYRAMFGGGAYWATGNLSPQREALKIKADGL